MSITKAQCLILAIMLMVGTLLSDQRVLGEEKGECDEQIQYIEKECSEFFQKTGVDKIVHPSKECCKSMKSVDVTCACEHVTPEVEKKIDMKKAVKTARQCGIRIKRGSYIIRGLEEDES